VILINLLPHREEKRRQRKRAFFVGLGACALAGVAVVGMWYSVLQQMTSAQESRNDFLKPKLRGWTCRSRTSPRCAPRSRH
jgi:type IV pilus assembly protein PilN